MNVRPVTSQDREAILALVPRLAATGTPPGRDAHQITATDIQTIAEAIERRQPGTQLLVAEQGGSLAGFIHLKTVTDYYTRQEIGHISDIVVAAEAEGQGVGRALMAAGEEWARARGYPMMELNVLVDNAGARALYERLGYSAEWVKYVKALP
jgi:ribosomal protein S18 acetylase RimI-like enzyme